MPSASCRDEVLSSWCSMITAAFGQKWVGLSVTLATAFGDVGLSTWHGTRKSPKMRQGATVFFAEAASGGRIARSVPVVLASLAVGLVDRVSEMWVLEDVSRCFKMSQVKQGCISWGAAGPIASKEAAEIAISLVQKRFQFDFLPKISSHFQECCAFGVSLIMCLLPCSCDRLLLDFFEFLQAKMEGRFALEQRHVQPAKCLCTWSIP